MINHSTCDHPSTSSARAKCRRQQGKAEVGFSPPLWSLGPPPKQATPKVIGKERNRGTTPGRRDLECDNCGVERIAYRGTDPVDGIMKYVGERCYYVVKHAPDIRPLD